MHCSAYLQAAWWTRYRYHHFFGDANKAWNVSHCSDRRDIWRIEYEMPSRHMPDAEAPRRIGFIASMICAASSMTCHFQSIRRGPGIRRATLDLHLSIFNCFDSHGISSIAEDAGVDARCATIVSRLVDGPLKVVVVRVDEQAVSRYLPADRQAINWSSSSSRYIFAI